MKTFTSRSVCSLALALLLVGGSAQAVTWADLYRPSTPAASTLTLVQNKSFFASHPVLKLGGIGLGAGAAAFLAVEGYRAWKHGVNYFSLLKNDLGFVSSKARKFVYAKHEDLVEVQKSLTEVDQKITDNNARLKSEALSLREDQRASIVLATEQLRNERKVLKAEETRLMIRLNEKQRIVAEKKAKSNDVTKPSEKTESASTSTPTATTTPNQDESANVDSKKETIVMADATKVKAQS